MSEQEKYIEQLHKAGLRFVIVGALLMLSVPLAISLITRRVAYRRIDV
jgi:hypothetical protein